MRHAPPNGCWLQRSWAGGAAGVKGMCKQTLRLLRPLRSCLSLQQLLVVQPTVSSTTDITFKHGLYGN